MSNLTRYIPLVTLELKVYKNTRVVYKIYDLERVWELYFVGRMNSLQHDLNIC
jgi:hypothetical protein